MAEAAVEIPKEVSTNEEKQPPVKKLCEDAFHYYLQGKRHMLVKDYSHAVQSLADSCELYVGHYGPLAPECGEVYFLYGKALFNYFQQQAGIFGDTVPEDEEEEEENGGSDDDKDEDEEEKAEEENEDSNDKDDDSESISSSKDGEKCETGKGDSRTENTTNDNEPTSTSDSTAVDTSLPKVQTESCEANEASEANGTAPEVSKDATKDVAEAGPSQSKEKTEDEVSDLQLAWENLETAKSIFQKKGDQKENELKVAEILLLLGEISLECDNYEAAIRDLKEGLIIWQKHLTPDDRRIAEIFYQLGLAHQLSDQSGKAIDYFHSTIDVILLRINILKNQTETKQNEDGFDIDPNIEIAELEALLPDIKSKIEDTKDLDKDAKKAMQELVAKKVEEVSVTSTSDEKPVSNINHLLKRKKPEEPDNTKTEEVKRIKLNSPATNVEEQRPSSSETTSPART